MKTLLKTLLFFMLILLLAVEAADAPSHLIIPRESLWPDMTKAERVYEQSHDEVLSRDSELTDFVDLIKNPSGEAMAGIKLGESGLQYYVKHGDWQKIREGGWEISLFDFIDSKLIFSPCMGEVPVEIDIKTHEAKPLDTSPTTWGNWNKLTCLIGADCYCFAGPFIAYKILTDEGRASMAGNPSFMDVYSKFIRKVKGEIGNKEFSASLIMCNQCGLQFRLIFAKEPEALAIYNPLQDSLTYTSKGPLPQDCGRMSEKTFGIVRSSDGLDIPYYLSCPLQKNRPYPTVLLVHGGPALQDQWGYEGQVQHLTSRGYAVLQVNFRGSSVSYAHYKRGWGEFGRLMQQDPYTVLEYLIQKGIINPDKVAIIGHSYGGYAALRAATTPECCFSIKGFKKFQCAISQAGLTCLNTLWKESEKKSQVLMCGPFLRVSQGVRELSKEQKTELKSISPLYEVDKLSCPVLLMHGEKDEAVSFNHSRMFSEAMTKASFQHTFVSFEKEGHDFELPANQRVVAYLKEVFLRKHMQGGEVEELNQADVRRSTLKILSDDGLFPIVRGLTDPEGR